ncbi:MAG: hypothetical protein JST16_14590 [Bdellovibrionales bacterium]|nr:hypothetical protein [Bdellovibrionales bacterium]
MKRLIQKTLLYTLSALPLWAAASGDDHKDHKEGGTEHGEEHGERHEESEESQSPGVGPGKAILEANHEKGFKLSEAALKMVGVKTAAVQVGAGGATVPKASLVLFQGEVGVYRVKDGWYKLIEVQIASRNKETAVVRSSELKSGDQVANEGVGLLRVADLDASGGNEEGHGH